MYKARDKKCRTEKCGYKALEVVNRQQSDFRQQTSAIRYQLPRPFRQSFRGGIDNGLRRDCRSAGSVDVAHGLLLRDLSDRVVDRGIELFLVMTSHT